MGIMEYSKKWENFCKEDIPVTSESATGFHVKGYKNTDSHHSRPGNSKYNYI